MEPEEDAPELEAVVRDNPALIIQDGNFGTLPPAWEHLEAKRDLLRAIIPSVGRLEIAGTNRSCGTAFVVGLGILMTNRHVIEEFADHPDGEWRIRPGETVRIDFREEHGGTAPSELLVDGVIGVDSEYDLALLRFAPTLDHVVKSLVVEGREPAPPIREREVAVIGYPDEDLAVSADQKARIFQNIFGVKRFQPGRIKGLRNHNGALVFSHDCSTTDGNSGSCVIDLETGRVLGLHFGGLTTANLAVPMWKVSTKPFLKDLNWAT